MEAGATGEDEGAVERRRYCTSSIDEGWGEKNTHIGFNTTAMKERCGNIHRSDKSVSNAHMLSSPSRLSGLVFSS